MNNYKKSISSIVSQLGKKLDRSINVVIIGDNSVGKSDVLRQLVNLYLEKSKNVYYIDAVNRSFDVSKVMLRTPNRSQEGFFYADGSLKSNGKYTLGISLADNVRQIVENRLKDDTFNLKDSFVSGYPAEEMYCDFKDDLGHIFMELTGSKIEFVRETLSELARESNAIYINRQKVLLSNGFQAVMRLLIELLYYQHTLKQKKQEHAVVIIDEIDKYLSPAYTAKILPLLQEKFPEFTLCVTTHSRDLLKYAADYLLCPLEQDKDGNVAYEFIDYKDVGSEKKVETIFSDLFFEEERTVTSSNSEIDTVLRRFLNLKLTDSWDENCEKEFCNLEYKELAPHQKLLYRQIEEW